MPDPPGLGSVADAIADRTTVDWDGLPVADMPPADRELVHQFRTISAMAAARRVGLAPAGPARARAFVSGSASIVALAILKLTLASWGLYWMISGAGPAAVAWPFAVNMIAFGVSGAVLLAGGSKDRRIRLLGGLFVIIASAFAEPLMPHVSGALGTAAAALHHLPTDAFLAAALWLFAGAFPGVPQHPLARRVSTVFLTAATAAGVILLGANALLAYEPIRSGAGFAFAVVRALDHDTATLAYWPLQFAIALPAMPYLLWRARFETVEHRRRIAFFVTALAAALTPMLVAVVASPFVPALGNPAWRRPIGLVLYAALMSVIPSTMYAVAVGRVMDVHLIVHRAMQHALAWYAVWIVSVAPLTYLVVDMYVNRELTVHQVFAQQAALVPIVLLVVGVVSLTFRHQLLHTVDRWFQRDTPDYTEALVRLDQGFRGARSIREISELLTREIDAALHPTNVAVLVANEADGQLVALTGGVRPLSTSAALADLARSARTEIQVNLADSALARLLPPADRQWLADGRIQLLFPLVGSTDRLLGLIALGPSRLGVRYAAPDRMLVAAMSGHAAIRLESLRRRPDGSADAAAETPALEWQHECGVYCPACSRVWAPGDHLCACGAETVAAVLPVVVVGKFRLERLVGFGGMGVVYQAVDIALDRKVAIKTLPTTTPDHVTRMLREARAMASVLHPNLALIFGAEHWRGSPLLVVEYLEGGTLSDRLRRGPVPVEEVIDLGVILADVLDRVHGSGVLHRDIKPSNIGFTGDGLPKLLDFGLATILDRSKGTDAPRVLDVDLDSLAEELEGLVATETLTLTQQIVGTPLYLSPEAIAGHTPEASFDLWSLTLVLYEALAGRHPIGDGKVATVLKRLSRPEIPDVRTYRPACPATVATFFERALAPALGRRPATASELRNQLQLLRANLDQKTA